jgi:hypothetical protein
VGAGLSLPIVNKTTAPMGRAGGRDGAATSASPRTGAKRSSRRGEHRHRRQLVGLAGSASVIVMNTDTHAYVEDGTGL